MASNLEESKALAEEAYKAVKDDWTKLSNILKFCLIGGGLSIMAGWLIKPSSPLINVYIHRHAYDFGAQELSVVLFFIFVCFIPLLAAILVQAKILWYRWRYPLNKIGDRFIFSSINGVVFVHDHKHKTIRWVESAKTALDLGYYPSIWLETIQRSNYVQKQIKNKDIANLDKYRIKHGIRTRGAPFKEL